MYLGSRGGRGNPNRVEGGWIDVGIVGECFILLGADKGCVTRDRKMAHALPKSP